MTKENLDAESPKKKRGRPAKIPTDVMIPKEPKIKGAKQFKKAVKIVCERKEKTELPEIDGDQFEKLCSFQCTPEEISDFFKVEEEGLIQWATKRYKRSFEKIYKIFSAPGLCSLRRSQFVLSKTNSQMAIWLGKIYLNQVDPIHSRVEETVDKLSDILVQIDEETRQILADRDGLNGISF